MLIIIVGDKENADVEKKKQQSISYNVSRREGGRLQKEWLAETVDSGIIGTVNRWMEEYIEERDKNR